MQTYTGRQFWPLDPHGDEIHVADIAHALSMLCRYGGHVKRFYSVAEHCVLMSRAVSPENALWALLHDATEAYMVDLPRPLKRQFLNYQEAELHLAMAIAVRFGLPALCPAEVSDADNRILLTERTALMREPAGPWGVDHLVPLPVTIECWSPAEAELEWLIRLQELTGDAHA